MSLLVESNYAGRVRFRWGVGVALVTLMLSGLLMGAPDAGATAGVVAGQLWLSTAADRSNPRALDQARLHGDEAIFVGAGPSTKSVSFYLDGATVPSRVEHSAPWDFAGTAPSGTAKLYNSDGLTAGVHRLRTVSQFTTGDPSKEMDAVFTVGATPDHLVTICGSRLCMGGAPWRVNGGSSNGNPRFSQSPAANIGLAVNLRVNTVRLTDFIPRPGRLGIDEYAAAQWQGVDGMIARAEQNNLKIELDLSTYRNFLQSQSPTFNPYTYSWTPFLTFVANRTNTVTGKRYGSDAGIAFVSFAGETGAPDQSESKARGVTATQLVSFYDKVMTTWGRLAPGQIRIPGGLFFLTDTTMPWREIFALSSCDLPAIHSYSTSDEKAQPVVAAYMASLAKPWYLEEFGFGAANYPSDTARAADFNRQEDLALKSGAQGVSFWNIDAPALNVTTAPLTAAAIRARSTGMAAIR